MNKKIILVGTILFILACFFVPVCDMWNWHDGVCTNVKEYHNLLTLKEEIAWRKLIAELLLITVGTLGLAYVKGNKGGRK